MLLLLLLSGKGERIYSPHPLYLLYIYKYIHVLYTQQQQWLRS